MRKILIGLAASWTSAALLYRPASAFPYPGTQSLPNGDFSQGNYGVWTISGDASINSDWANFMAPSGESQLNLLGTITQQVTVPVQLPVLGFGLQTASSAPPGTGNDQFKVLVLFLTATTIPVSQPDTTRWETRLTDLSAWAGQSIHLSLQLDTDDVDPSWAFVDFVFFAPQGYIFSDGFEDGAVGTERWSSTVP